MQSARLLIKAMPSALLRTTTRNSIVINPRFLSVASHEPSRMRPENVDFVKDAITRMMEKEDENLKPICNEELIQTFQHFRNVYQEALACMEDCEEATATGEFTQELGDATAAVEEVFSAYVDLLDDVRRANEEQLEPFKTDRSSFPQSLQILRQKLEQLESAKLTQVQR